MPTQRKNEPHKIKWVVSPYRKDKRTGALDPVPMDRYTKYAFDEIERFFHGNKTAGADKKSPKRN